MNRLLKFSICSMIPILMLFITTSLYAQSQEQREKFEQEKKDFFNEKLDFTEEEAEKFWPVYNDYNNRMMKLSEEERNTLQYVRKNYENINEEEVTESLNKLGDIYNQKHKLGIEYHEKCLKFLPEKKVLMFYVVEREFRRHVINRIRHREGRGNDNRGRGQGSKDNRPPIPGHSPESF